MTVPEGILPGQAINIIVPKQTEQAVVDLTNGNDTTVFNSVEGVRDAAVLQAKGEEASLSPRRMFLRNVAFDVNILFTT